MQHAAEISAGDSSDSKVERAMKQRDYFLQQITASEQISKTIQSGYNYGVSAAIALKPENVSKTMKYAAAKFRTLTWAQLLIETLKLGYRLGKGIFMFLVFIVLTFFRFIFYLTSPEDISKEEREHGQPLSAFTEQHHAAPPVNNMAFFRPAHRNVDVFGINIQRDEANGAPPNLSPPIVEEPTPNGPQAHPNQGDYSSQEIPEDPKPPSANGNIPTDEFVDEDNLLKPPQPGQQRRSPSIYDTQSFASQPMQLSVPSVTQQEELRIPFYEPKIAEQMATKSKGSVLNVLARNFKTIEKITLYSAFFINVILLFHRVDIAMSREDGKQGEEKEDDEEDSVDEIMESVYIAGMIIPYFAYEITGWLLVQVSFWWRS